MAKTKKDIKAKVSKTRDVIAKEILKQVKVKVSKVSKEALKNSLKNPANTASKELNDIKKYYYMNDDNINSVMVIQKIMEVLEIYLKTIQQILQPEEFHALYESSAFDEDEKAELFAIYKKAIMLHRELLKTLIINDEKNSINTIKRVHNDSLQLKSQMINAVEKLQKSWKIENNEKKSKSAHYFG